jgi:hypothetical protein
MPQQIDSLDAEVSEMLQFYQAAAARSDAYVDRSGADLDHSAPQQPGGRHPMLPRPLGTGSRREHR